MATLKEKAQKSIALSGDGFEDYKGFAINKDDETMFVSKEEVNKYLDEAADRIRKAILD